MTIVMIGIDLGKISCSVAALDESGAVVLRRRMRPGSIVGFAAKYAPCTVAMEACCGAHYLGRLLLAQGHTVKLMPPEYVRPYVKAQKNDDRDAAGDCLHRKAHVGILHHRPSPVLARRLLWLGRSITWLRACPSCQAYPSSSRHDPQERS